MTTIYSSVFLSFWKTQSGIVKHQMSQIKAVREPHANNHSVAIWPFGAIFDKNGNFESDFREKMVWS